jgi:superoxide reductase
LKSCITNVIIYLIKEENIYMTNVRFYVCKRCGKIIAIVKDTPSKVYCCGEPMQPIEPNTTDAAVEKHVPVAEIDGNIVKVTVGSQPHPMTEEHLIEWISIHTLQGNQRKELTAGAEPKAVFALAEGDKLLEVYAYCNKHGLWKATV